MFYDEAKIHIKSGDGGDGMISFRREKFVRQGGPDGGDGGRGGDIIFATNSHLNSLAAFQRNKHYRAGNGVHGTVQRMTGAVSEPRQILTPDELIEMQRQADAVYVDPNLMEYAVRLVTATRRPAEYRLSEIARYISFGASPRASINLVLGARALAMLRGRDYVLPNDISELAPDVLRHRLVLSYEAFADGTSADEILTLILNQVPVPDRPLVAAERETHTGIAGS